MILVIPSIELSNGICCDIIHGEVGTESLYDKFFRNPCELIKLWRRENAKSVHISDLDSFTMESAEVNINGIIYLTEMTDIPITLAHNFKDIELCNIFLTAGVYRIFISKLFLSNAYEIQQLCEKYTASRICAFIETDGIYAYYNNNTLRILLSDLLPIIKSTGVNRILYKNIKRRMSVSDSEIEELKDIYNRYKLRITIDGGVNCTNDLLRINSYAQPAVDSIIIGTPFYNNRFPCQKIWRKVEADLETKIVN